jgi:hypothetical protein
MTLLDRFRAQPPLKHADPVVRLAYVQETPIDERELLGEIAREDVDARVRRAAVAKLLDAAALAVIAEKDADEGVREEAIGMLRDIALDAFEGLGINESLAAVDGLQDGRTLAVVAKTALRDEVALRALWRVADVHALGSIARHAQLEGVRLAALAALQDHDEIVRVALNSEFKDTGIAAVERLESRADLEDVAVRSKNKSVAKRARAILREADERVAAEAAEQAEATAAAPRDELQEVDAQKRAEEDAGRRETERLEAEAAQAQPQEETEAARQRAEEQAQGERALQQQADEDRRRQDEQVARERQRQAARAETEAREARTRVEALTRLSQLAARAEGLVGNPDVTLKAGERALRDVKAALAGLPPLPSRAAHEEISLRLKNAHSILSARVQELRELTDWQRWANLGLQEQLCVKMEALAALENPTEIMRHVRELQEQWRAASDVPRSQGDVWWRRFKTAHDVVWARCEAHFAAEAQTRAENLGRKTALCEEAEALADSTRWIQTAEEIKRLQSEWKSIGAVTRGQEKAVWERFRSACDRFFTRRQADLAEHKKRWAANLERKLALCAQVEALADSTEWEPTAAAIRRLQQEWKSIGPVRKSRSEAVWQRFRGACDRFFVRYAQRYHLARGERVAAREAICAELEALVPSAQTGGPPQDRAALLGKVRALRARWQQEIAARGVDRERAALLDQRFGSAFARIVGSAPEAFAGSDLDPSANRKRMETLVRRVEELASSMGPSSTANDATLSPTSRAAAMLKEALAANTIGGKVDEGSRMRAAAEEVRQAQAAWARIGPVPDDIRIALADRFNRACRRVAEQTGPPGQTGHGGRST